MKFYCSFALEMVMFNTEDHNKQEPLTRNTTQVQQPESLDDEYSPGVFQVSFDIVFIYYYQCLLFYLQHPLVAT